MKQFDLVKLINDKPYKSKNLHTNMHGIVIDSKKDELKILLFNTENLGDYVVADINEQDVIIEENTLPNEIQTELKKNLNKIISKAKPTLTKININNYDKVELLVEDTKYSKFGIHKGYTGCVVNNTAIKNYIEVDFGGVDKNGNFYGDCIAVKIDDLKIIK